MNGPILIYHCQHHPGACHVTGWEWVMVGTAPLLVLLLILAVFRLIDRRGQR